MSFRGSGLFERESNRWAIKPTLMEQDEQKLLRISPWKVDPLARSIWGYSSNGFVYYLDPVKMLPTLVRQLLIDAEYY
ncbi:unnamed protein product [Orchesella dallaii]|uniref:Uncharacterized protein n=1 Tax=Orchesella dallaii TaxID=48710 RepID=A0ABP1RX11_9HEXA